jgi:hypothetical protein
MKIILGTGNSVTTAFNVSEKLLTFTGAYNFDILAEESSIWNSTRNAWMWNAPEGSTASASAASGEAITYSGGLPVQYIRLNALPASSASGDTLVITCDCPGDIAQYNAFVALG